MEDERRRRIYTFEGYAVDPQTGEVVGDDQIYVHQQQYRRGDEGYVDSMGELSVFFPDYAVGSVVVGDRRLSRINSRVVISSRSRSLGRLLKYIRALGMKVSRSVAVESAYTARTIYSRDPAAMSLALSSYGAAAVAAAIVYRVALKHGAMKPADRRDKHILGVDSSLVKGAMKALAKHLPWERSIPLRFDGAPPYVLELAKSILDRYRSASGKPITTATVAGAIYLAAVLSGEQGTVTQSAISREYRVTDAAIRRVFTDISRALGIDVRFCRKCIAHSVGETCRLCGRKLDPAGGSRS